MPTDPQEMEKVIERKEIVNSLEENIKISERSVLKKGIKLEQNNVHRPNYNINFESNDAIKHLCISVEAYNESLMVVLKRATKDKKKLSQSTEVNPKQICQR